MLNTVNLRLAKLQPILKVKLGSTSQLLRLDKLGGSKRGSSWLL